jgi:hypothetical protein
MSRLDDFLSLPNVNNITETIHVNDRIGDLVVKPMTVAQHKSYQDRCRGKVNKNGVTFDYSKFNALVMIGQTVDPDFSDADFLQKAGYLTAADFVNAKFKAGEVTEIATQIIQLSGFDVDMDDRIDEAKNS